MDAPEKKPCRSCKTANAVPYKRGRCAACDADFQLWLAGGVHHVPEWNGVVAQPPDAEVERSAYDQALSVRAMMDVE